jgi:hypothetical protein
MNTVGRLSVLAMAALSCSKEYTVVALEPDVNPSDYMPCEFSPADDAHMSVYDCNPVFETTDEMWFSDTSAGADMNVGSVGFYTNLVMGYPVYQIWYTARLDEGTSAEEGTDFLADWGLGTAVSENGVDWDPHVDNALMGEIEGAWDQDGMNAIQIARDDRHDRYVMSYQGYRFDGVSFSIGVGAAESRDGVRWSRTDANPVLMQGVEYEGGLFIDWPLALYVSEGGGITSYMGAHTSADVVDMYAVEVSEDLSEWHIFDDPVLTAGPESYDQAGITAASVVKLGDTFYMFYIGAGGWEDIIGGARVPVSQTLNLATSATGISWTKHSGNPISVHLTSAKELDGVAAQVVGDTIHLWVTDNYAEPTATSVRAAVGYYLYTP